MPLSFDPDWTGSNVASAGSSFNVPSSNIPVGEDVITLWVAAAGSPAPVVSSVTQLDSSASPVGAAFTVENYTIPSGGLVAAWGTRDPALDSLQVAFSTGYTAFAFVAANLPAGTYGTVTSTSYAAVAPITPTMPGTGIFAGVASKPGGLDFIDSSTFDDYSDGAVETIVSPAVRIHGFAGETTGTDPTITFDIASGAGFSRFHALGPVTTSRWYLGRVGWSG